MVAFIIWIATMVLLWHGPRVVASMRLWRDSRRDWHDPHAREAWMELKRFANEHSERLGKEIEESKRKVERLDRELADCRNRADLEARQLRLRVLRTEFEKRLRDDSARLRRRNRIQP